MFKLSKLISMLFLYSLVGCSDYISSKRDGLKPFDDDQKQAQEKNEEKN